MKRRGISANNQTYNGILDGLVKADKWEEVQIYRFKKGFFEFQ